MMRKQILAILFLGMALLFAACAPKGASNPVETSAPLTIQDIPTITPLPATPQGESLTVGFNIRGWT